MQRGLWPTCMWGTGLLVPPESPRALGCLVPFFVLSVCSGLVPVSGLAQWPNVEVLVWEDPTMSLGWHLRSRCLGRAVSAMRPFPRGATCSWFSGSTALPCLALPTPSEWHFKGCKLAGLCCFLVLPTAA